ncbi:sodium-driven chloride bicarbonate exchanger, putative [Pediculus humanus corporis]|uniref:Anion exchange protein n=1 Tax=Pediculus humanus subsp. corporis TaxID=121224 RepID=E0VCN3_PEDHC|nr:sodium-driven chloride bicarbonate exchanger, putative [Pediculus humanus corporis]EEB11139.1 sodium-driven chloride bicarbonate exchanger, putative [Pediculus humanus corporis]
MDPSPGDDEAPRDPGVLKIHQPSYTDEDFEGHRANTVFVGVHMPDKKHSHRRHRHHNRKDSVDEEDRPITPPAQRVQFILGEDAEDGVHEPHPLFSEMEELVTDGDQAEWKETARWIKFEEDVEEGGNRWSKPHVATLSLHSLFELRSFLLNGTVMLDMEATSLEQIADLILDNMVNSGSLTLESKDKVKEVLLRRHRHQHEQRRRDNSSTNMSRLPIIRSLAEIGRNHSSSKKKQQPKQTMFVGYFFYRSYNTHNKQQSMVLLKFIINNITKRFNVQSNIDRSPSSTSISRNHSASGLGDGNGDHTKGNTHFMRKIPAGAEASNILVGQVNFLEKPLSAFIRLNQGTFLGDLTEVPVPTRFLFILLGPTGGITAFHEVGRAMATLMSDEVFHDVAYKARNRNHLLAAVDEFLDAVTVLPPGEWDPTIRIEPPAAIPSQVSLLLFVLPPLTLHQTSGRDHRKKYRTGRLFGGLINDVKRKVPWYWSDFKDALAMQCIASWIFLYFACLSPIITFGGLLGTATGNNMAAMESLVSGFVCGMGYGFFSGQPLTILGSTGPVLVFETIVYDFCQGRDWDYLSFRLWIGAWIFVILLVLVAVDASALVCYITRFTEENFATLIAFIFIYKAVENVIKIGVKYPIETIGGPAANVCICEPPTTQMGGSPLTDDVMNWTILTNEECLRNNGTLVGHGCPGQGYVPDVFLMSILLFIGTFLISVELKDFKNALFFPSKVRQFISDFAVIIAILSMSLIDWYVGIKTPKLQVPSDFKPTLDGRGWLIPPFGKNPIWSWVVAVLPALLGTILIFMDQQITAVIVNRKENKLKKGCGYHLDLFILALLILICSVMGLPWFVAATVLSINHVNSLKLESECAAPGEKPQFLGVREQRVTHILIFLMIGLSVILTPVLSNIPMPVLFGVFLYMGVASLKGLQFFDRILIMFMPVKYQPDYMFLRQVPLRRVHLFTAIQLICLIALWVIKSFSTTSILFPLMLVVMIGIRKSLDFVFTRRELKILDDVMPEVTKRSKEDEWNLKEGRGNLQISLANGNIMKIPLSSINISEEVNKSGVWKTVNDSNTDKSKNHSSKPRYHFFLTRWINGGGWGKNNHFFFLLKFSSSKSKRRGSKKDALTEEERRRLSTMNEAEEEEDARSGITIKVGADSQVESQV